MANRDPSRRFLQLEVDEVSVVDTPANEVEFLVTKNDLSEESPMGEPAVKEPAQTQTVPVEQEVTGEEERVNKALTAVNGIVANIVSLAKGGASADGNSGEPQGEPEPTETEKAKKGKKNFGQMMKETLSKAGLQGDALEKAVDDAAKAMGFNRDQEFPTASPPVTKAAEPEPAPESSTDDQSEASMMALADSIQKAARLTPARVAKLSEALELLKLVIEGVQPNTSPPTRTPGNASFGASGVQSLMQPNTPPRVTKSADGGEDEVLTQIAKGLTGLTEAFKDLNTRVEKVEKARPAPNSEDNGGTNGKPTETKKSLWAGVL